MIAGYAAASTNIVLVSERNLSRNMQARYRDTLTLLLPFASEHSGRASIG